MIKCNCTECINHAKNSAQCRRSEIVLDDTAVHTPDGYMMVWICRQYKESGRFTELQKAIRLAIRETK